MNTYRKKLIEVALPLEAINKESAREKSIRHGHPSTLHLWWARRPLAACRAVLFAQMVDDPSEYMPDEQSADNERQRLFELIEELVKWENINNEEVLDKARLEIAKSVARDLGEDVPIGKEAIREFLSTKAPPVLDPFAGGGSIPLEAQRLGLRAYASDLNPVAVLINKAMIEIPPKFAGLPPVHPDEVLTTNEHEFSRMIKGEEGQTTNKHELSRMKDDQEEETTNSHKYTRIKNKKTTKAKQEEMWKKDWKGAEGLAEDVCYYGKWMRDETKKRIGHLYPKYKITQELLDERVDLREQGLKAGDELTVIAWLWARTVKCPNPACGVEMPLVRSFWLSKKKEKESWVEPIAAQAENPPEGKYGLHIEFLIKTGTGQPSEGTMKRNGAHCAVCDTSVTLGYIRSEGKANRMGALLMAIVAEGKRGRVYFPPNEEHEIIVEKAIPKWKPEQELQGKCRVSVPLYGMNTYGDLFTNRQLCALTTFSDMVSEVHDLVEKDIKRKGDGKYQKYADAVVTYLAFAVDKGANYWSKICAWHNNAEKMVSTFSRQAIPMVWDFTEANPFSNSSGNFLLGIDQAKKIIENSLKGLGKTMHKNAASGNWDIINPIISTDPPYYDNIQYADLSDYFYIWLRKMLSDYYPDLFNTMLVPKSSEIVASPYRLDGNMDEAKIFFEKKLTSVFAHLYQRSDHHFPISIYYAFKQSEEISSSNDKYQEELSSHSSTGWETILDALISNKFQITGSWPVRTEYTGNLKKKTSSLASSIVLVCRRRSENAKSITNREFESELKSKLPTSIKNLQQGSIAPVDLPQAAIGPGIAIFTNYDQVLEADGSSVSVRKALIKINETLDQFLSEYDVEIDSFTSWAMAWYEQYGFNEGPYGVSETLSKAKNISIEGLVEAGILQARAGKVRLLKRDELPEDWDPQQDKRMTTWEAVQHLIRRLDESGESAAAMLLSKLGGHAETARDLAYRLYTICERKGWAQDALGYNMLVVAYPRLKELARRKPEADQGQLL
jgi:putative DNA methylase